MADNYTFKDAGGLVVTHASDELSAGVHASKHIEIDDAGTPIYKAEDAAHSSGDKGIMALAVRKDTAAALAGTDGDYIPLIVDSTGRLHVNTGTTASTAAGDVANDSADSGNPIKIGGKAASATTAPTAVSAGDRVNAYYDLNGRLVTLPSAMYVADDVDTVSTDSAGHLRMTQYRELIVAPNMLRAQYFSNSSVANPTDITVGVSNWYTGSGPTTAFFDGSDGAFDGAARYIQIPMFRFARGATIGLFNTLGVSLTVKLRARITSYNGSNAANGWYIYSGSVAHNAYLHFSPMPLHATAEPEWNYIPQLNSPIDAIVIELTPASDPSSGYFVLTVMR